MVAAPGNVRELYVRDPGRCKADHPRLDAAKPVTLDPDMPRADPIGSCSMYVGLHAMHDLADVYRYVGLVAAPSSASSLIAILLICISNLSVWIPTCPY